MTVTIDVAGGPMGGAARFRAELYRYLDDTGRADVRVIGAERRVGPSWLVRREVLTSARTRRVALNNVGFVRPGGERWTLVANALHFLADDEAARLDPALLTAMRRQGSVVRAAARRSEVVVAPCTSMAERIARAMPDVTGRVAVRMHPIGANPVPKQASGNFILSPVIFEPYKEMVPRLREWVAAVDAHLDPEVRLVVTATPADLPTDLACHPRISCTGQLPHDELCQLWARSRAVFFPPGLESFGFPLAEARAYGQPVIARDTEQNREIAGGALCGFTVGDADSLRQATDTALATQVAPDPEPFSPRAYFDWMLGPGA
ncbi:MAG: glycosyltransferase [Actinomycetota bacterium]